MYNVLLGQPFVGYHSQTLATILLRETDALGSVRRHEQKQADLLELQLLDVLAQALLKNFEDLLPAALATVHGLAKRLLKLAAQAEDEVHHASPAGHWGATHTAQLLLQSSNTCSASILHNKQHNPATTAVTQGKLHARWLPKSCRFCA